MLDLFTVTVRESCGVIIDRLQFLDAGLPRRSGTVRAAAGMRRSAHAVFSDVGGGAVGGGAVPGPSTAVGGSLGLCHGAGLGGERGLLGPSGRGPCVGAGGRRVRGSLLITLSIGRVRCQPVRQSVRSV